MKPWFGDVLRVSTSQTQGRHVLDYMASAQIPVPEKPTENERKETH